MSKKEIKEALNRIDNSCIDRRLKYYNLTGLYESATLSKEDEEDLGKVLFELKDNVSEKDTERLHNMLNVNDLGEKFEDCSKDEDSMSEFLRTDFDLDKEEIEESLVEEVLPADKEQIKKELETTVRESLKRKLGYDDEFVDNYVFVEVEDSEFADGEPAVKAEIRWEVGYEEGLPVIEDLNKVIAKYDPQSYFDHETGTVINAYVRLDQSDDIVDEDTLKDYMDLLDSCSTKDELISVYMQARKAALEDNEMTYATYRAIGDYATELVNERFSDLKESLMEAGFFKGLKDKLSNSTNVYDEKKGLEAIKKVEDGIKGLQTDIDNIGKASVEDIQNGKVQLATANESLEESLNESYYNIMTIGDIRYGSIGNMSDEEIDLDDKIFRTIGRHFHKNPDDVYVVVADNEEVLDPKDYEDVFDSYSDSNLFGERMKGYDIRALHLDLSGKKYEVIREVRNGTTFLYFEDDYNANDFIDELSAETKRFYGESLKEDLSYTDLVIVQDEWEKFKERTGRSDPDSAREFIRTTFGGVNNAYTQDELEDMFGVISDIESENESLTESDEETPYTEEEVEADLKSLTNNWTNRDGSVRSGFKEEQRHAVNVLRKHYNYVDTSYDDRPGVQLHYIVAYSSPMGIGKDSDGNIVRDVDESLKEDSKDIYMRGKEYRSADDFYASADLKELENSLIGKEFDKDDVFGKLRETFNERAVSIMNPNMQIALGLSYLIEDQTGENVLDVDWEEKDGRIVLTHIDFIDDSEVDDDDNDTLDESKKLNESSVQLGEYVVKDGDLDIVAEYHWDKGNTYQVTVGDYKDSIQYGPLMFDRRYYTEEDAKRAFNRKVRELKRNYENRSNAL